MKEFDCFRKQKDSAFTESMHAINMVVKTTADFYRAHPENNDKTIDQLESFFHKLLRVRITDFVTLFYINP